MKTHLSIYLNDHLAGAAAGLILATRLHETSSDPQEARFFADLKSKIAEESEMLKGMMCDAGFKVGSFRQAIGSAAAHASIVKMNMEGTDTGELGRFEMIELLTVGIHGKGLLWKSLDTIQVLIPAWQDRDFKKLEEDAHGQEVEIEGYRTREALSVFASPEDDGYGLA